MRWSPMRAASSVTLAAAAGIALGCATSSVPDAGAASVSAAPAAQDAANGADEAAVVRSGREGWRLGVWELDLVALDREPRGTTFRLLDLKILKLLEIGGGDDYYSFALLETPGVIEPITVRRDGVTEELRLVDVQALALLRRTRDSSTEAETRVVKPPVLRSLYGTTQDGADQSVEYLFVFRQEVER